MPKVWTPWRRKEQNGFKVVAVTEISVWNSSADRRCTYVQISYARTAVAKREQENLMKTKYFWTTTSTSTVPTTDAVWSCTRIIYHLKWCITRWWCVVERRKIGHHTHTHTHMCGVCVWRYWWRYTTGLHRILYICRRALDIMQFESGAWAHV